MKNYKINFDYINNKKSKTIVFLHGWKGQKEIFNFYVHFFNNNYNIINFDLYGFGESALPKPVFSIYEYALNIYLVLAKIKTDEITLICHSFGCRIALILASVFNLTINNLIILDGAGIKPKFNLLVWGKIKLYKIAKILKFKSNCFGSKDYKNSKEIINTFVKIVNEHLNYLLSGIKSKTLIIWGSRDKETPLYMARIIYKSIAKSQIEILEGSHFLFLEKKLYVCNKILKFINSK